MHHFCNSSKLNRYQYKGYWIEIFLEPDWEQNCFLYTALVELPSEGGVVPSQSYETRGEAESAAEELIDSWNPHPPRGGVVHSPKS